VKPDVSDTHINLLTYLSSLVSRDSSLSKLLYVLIIALVGIGIYLFHYKPQQEKAQLEKEGLGDDQVEGQEIAEVFPEDD
jgi:hypothetical protein